MMKKLYTAWIIPIFKDHGVNKYLYLIVQGKENGFWSFPKGQMLQWETIQECAKRELFEETGIKDINIYFDKPYEMEFTFMENGTEFIKNLTFFYGYVKNMESKIQESEICNYKRATFKECKELLSFEDLKEMIGSIHNNIVHTHLPWKHFPIA